MASRRVSRCKFKLFFFEVGNRCKDQKLRERPAHRWIASTTLWSQKSRQGLQRCEWWNFFYGKPLQNAQWWQSTQWTWKPPQTWQSKRWNCRCSKTTRRAKVFALGKIKTEQRSWRWDEQVKTFVRWKIFWIESFKRWGRRERRLSYRASLTAI